MFSFGVSELVAWHISKAHRHPMRYAFSFIALVAFLQPCAGINISNRNCFRMNNSCQCDSNMAFFSGALNAINNYSFDIAPPFSHCRWPYSMVLEKLVLAFHNTSSHFDNYFPSVRIISHFLSQLYPRGIYVGENGPDNDGYLFAWSPNPTTTTYCFNLTNLVNRKNNNSDFHDGLWAYFSYNAYKGLYIRSPGLNNHFSVQVVRGREETTIGINFKYTAQWSCIPQNSPDDENPPNLPPICSTLDPKTDVLTEVHCQAASEPSSSSSSPSLPVSIGAGAGAGVVVAVVISCFMWMRLRKPPTFSNSASNVPLANVPLEQTA